MPYREDVHANPAVRFGLWALVVVPTLVAAVGAAIDGEWLASVLVAVGVLVFMAVLDRWFMVLRVRVEPSGVEARFGPFSKQLPATQVESVEAMPYRWTPYLGWGIRFASGKRYAWSVPFIREGVSVALGDGARYFISSRQPERLVAAVAEVIDRRRGTRG